MARPHPVGALFVPANFLHIRHMFVAEEMLLCPSWHCSFSGVRVFVVNMCTSVMHPPVAFMFAGSSRFTFAGLSCTPYPKWVTFLVLRWFPSNTTYAAQIFWIKNTLFFFFLLSFFWGVTWIMFPVDVSKHCCSASLPHRKSILWPLVW